MEPIKALGAKDEAQYNVMNLHMIRKGEISSNCIKGLFIQIL